MCDFHDFSNFNSWTKDIQSCPLTGIGYSVNSTYVSDDHRVPSKGFHETSFCLLLDEKEDISLYGVLDGFNGIEATHFVSYHLPFEIKFNQPLRADKTDKEVFELLSTAILEIEKEYHLSKSELFAIRTDCRYELQEIEEKGIKEKIPELQQKLLKTNEKINCGTTLVLGFLLKNRLFISNIGKCRAVLCTKDEDGHFDALQLTQDHDLKNPLERKRLCEIGLNEIDNDENNELFVTRCIGNFGVKGGYLESSFLSKATSEPVIAEPEIYGPVIIDESSQFLLLFSDGLYNSLIEATNTSTVNKDIVQMVLEEFKKQSSLMDVAQNVVNRVCKLHQDKFSNSTEITGIDDMSLLVRLFYHEWDFGPWNGGISSSNFSPLTVNISDDDDFSDSMILDNYPLETNLPQSYTEETLTSSGSEIHCYSNSGLQDEMEKEKDEEGKIVAYVDFDELNKLFGSEEGANLFNSIHFT